MPLDLKNIILSNNVAEFLSDEDREAIGREVIHNFDIDKRSREDWEKRTEEALKLALQVVEEKSFPWPNASNIKFPLITIAALQYHARSYPALVSGTKLVKCRVFGEDKDGKLEATAKRVEDHMSFQLLEEDENWEDQMDRVLITQPIVGCAFKKSYFDSFKGHNVSEQVLAQDLVVPYFTKSLETATRISHVIYLSHNDVYERVQAGLFLDVPLSNNLKLTQDRLGMAQDQAQGVREVDEDKDKAFEFIEQHCSLDLDDDGYKEPYIVVVHRESKTLVRIVARFLPTSVSWKGDSVQRIVAENYFTKFPFIPSPDGGFYDLGFGALLGPLNDSINTLINQLIDAGTMSNTGGGFLGRGIKIRGGTQGFQPQEWKQVETAGDDLRKNIMPLPVREPSQVLFTLLSLLISYGERIGGAVDVLVGENPGQNTPAETSRTMAEQGMKIFMGIFKRTYRSLKQEYRKLYRLNQLHLEDNVFGISAEDYIGSSKAIVPAADPDMITDSQRLSQASLLLQTANPAVGYNMYEVHKFILKSYKINDIETVLPNPKGPNAMPPFKPPQIILEEIKAKAAEEKEKIKGSITEMKVKADLQAKMAELQIEAELNQAKIDQLQSDALLKLQQADSEEAHILIAAIDAQIGAAKTHQDHLLNTIKLISDITKERTKVNESTNEAGV